MGVRHRGRGTGPSRMERDFEMETPFWIRKGVSEPGEASRAPRRHKFHFEMFFACGVEASISKRKVQFEMRNAFGNAGRESGMDFAFANRLCISEWGLQSGKVWETFWEIWSAVAR